MEAQWVICAEAKKCIFDFGAEMVQKWCNFNEARRPAISDLCGDGGVTVSAKARGGRRLVKWALRAVIKRTFDFGAEMVQKRCNSVMT